MPVTQARQFRLDETIIAQINELAAIWGGKIKPLTHTEVIREAIRRAHKAETKPAKKKS
jgi:hypothetical protein